MILVYISIGNSDDKLTQKEWSQFWIEFAAEVISVAKVIHGAWFSNPAGQFQNACWCVEFENEIKEKEARQTATEVRQRFRQDSVAWAFVPETEFI